jgi:hypothetical protein
VMYIYFIYSRNQTTPVPQCRRLHASAACIGRTSDGACSACFTRMI